MERRARILAISGSLRKHSSNTELLRAAAIVMEGSAEFVIYKGLARLPHFNPDLDHDGAELPPAIVDLRRELDQADALIISSPEYAHGVPGSLKNALDWLVSGSEIVGKPTGLLNASARAEHAHSALGEILRTMSAALVDEAIAVIGIDGLQIQGEQLAADYSIAGQIQEAVASLIVSIKVEV
jgi:chromate reductase, NAD(P)H dehydrogenase (quinone)